MPPALAVAFASGSFPLPQGIVRGIPERSRRTRLSLAVPALDALFGEGLPCGVITEVFGHNSSGRTALAHVLVAAAMAAGECAAWVDLPNAFDPDCANIAGVELERVLWVHPADSVAAFRVVEHVIGAGGFRLVVLDLGDPAHWRSPVPASTWLRVTHAAVRHDAAVVVLTAAHVAGTFAALSLEASLQRRIFVGADGPSCLFAGMISTLHLRKNKLGPPASAPVDLFVSTSA